MRRLLRRHSSARRLSELDVGQRAPRPSVDPHETRGLHGVSKSPARAAALRTRQDESFCVSLPLRTRKARQGRTARSSPPKRDAPRRMDFLSGMFASSNTTHRTSENCRLHASPRQRRCRGDAAVAYVVANALYASPPRSCKRRRHGGNKPATNGTRPTTRRRRITTPPRPPAADFSPGLGRGRRLRPAAAGEPFASVSCRTRC